MKDFKIKDTNASGSQLFLNADGSRTTIHDRPRPTRKPKRKPKGKK